MNVAIIPARGGSKRIPGKNIKPFAGRPIISYPIEAARKSGIFHKIIVSTDDQEIAGAATECGVEVPFTRPLELSGDFTPTAPVIEHALQWMLCQKIQPAYVCCIYATAPFLQPEYIRQGFDLITAKKVSSVFSVTTFPFPVFRALKIEKQGQLSMLWPEYELSRSNDFPETYHDAGQFYWLDPGVFLKEKKLYGRDALPVILPRHLVQDIDTMEDWETAERMFAALKLKETLHAEKW